MNSSTKRSHAAETPPSGDNGMVQTRKKLRVEKGHPDGINRPGISSATQFLDSIDKMTGLVVSTYSRDVWADVDPNPQHYLDSGWRATLASQLSEINVSDDVKLAWALVNTKFSNKGLIDDRNDKVLESIVKVVSSLQSGSDHQKLLSNLLVNKLWIQLQHPPMTYLGTRTFAPMRGRKLDVATPAQGIAETKVDTPEDWVFHQEWRYRSADGTNNSRLNPHLGQAGSPYARTVKPGTILPANLPDPGLVFDELMAADRDSPRREHPAGVSSMLFYLATIIIHDCFETDPQDPNTNTTSSYLDLSPLYGKDGNQQKTVRTFTNGTLKPDTFAEVRILGFPPGVAALLICFNRYHNYVVGQLKEINEGGRFTLPSNPSKEDIRKHDHNLFQTGRLITCGLYINIVLIDYVRTILNMNRSNSPWRLDPRENLEVYGPSNIPEGIGNQVSVEFNLLYRWHSAISRRDEDWSNRFFQELLQGDSRNPEDLTDEDLKEIFHKFKDAYSKDPSEWQIRDQEGKVIQRNERGSLDDEALNTLITEGTDDLAGAFGARNVPLCMKSIEMGGIRLARGWNVASLNEFRGYFGLKPHDSFRSISTIPGVAQSLQALYGHPDNVELYPGLVAEDAKEPEAPGSGLCPGLTIGAAILADAVNLVRGDRFYTVDFTAANLTNWGYTQVQSDTNVAGGGVMYKLLTKAFPGYYTGNSVYAMYPFTVPSGELGMMQALEELGQGGDFDDSRPVYKPLFSAHVTSFDAVTKVLGDHDNFKVPWGRHIRNIINAEDMLGGDGQVDAQQHKQWKEAMGITPAHPDAMKGQLKQVQKLFETVMVDLLRERTTKTRSGYQVDAIADIGNEAVAIAAAHFFHVQLKSEEYKDGQLTAQQLYTIMALCFAYTFLDVDESKDFSLRLYATQAGSAVMNLVKIDVEAVKHKDTLGRLLNLFPGYKHADDLAETFGAVLIKKLLAKGMTAEDITAQLVPNLAGMIAPISQQFAQILDFYWSDKYISHWTTIKHLSHSSLDSDFQTLVGYVHEAMRLSPAAFGLFRTVNPANGADSISVPGCVDPSNPTSPTTTTQTLPAGSTIFVDFLTAGLDPAKFGTDPTIVDPHRDRNLYIQQGFGMHACIGASFTPTALAAMLRVFARLDGVTPVGQKFKNEDGGESYLQSRPISPALPKDARGGLGKLPFKVFMKADGSDDWPFPSTLKVRFEGFNTAGMEISHHDWEGNQGQLFKCDMEEKEEEEGQERKGGVWRTAMGIFH